MKPIHARRVWSTYGAEGTQPRATAGKGTGRETRSATCGLLLTVVTRCDQLCMVRQFQVHSCTTVLPATIGGIRAYLGPGMIKGIGPGMAERMVAHFGTGILDVIEHHAGRLTEVHGLGPSGPVGLWPGSRPSPCGPGPPLAGIVADVVPLVVVDQPVQAPGDPLHQVPLV